jgi:anti-sigma factor RsiW
MNCREFRAQHCAFVDDTLSLVDMASMRGHLEACASCAKHDTRVRRSLMLVRNAPELECSAGFSDRLHARLREIGPVDRRCTSSPLGIRSAFGISAVAAGLLTAAAAAAIAIAATLDRPVPEVRMAPVIASIPADDPMSISGPAYVASVMSGMPVWSAVVGAGESSMHMANYEFQLVNNY